MPRANSSQQLDMNEILMRLKSLGGGGGRVPCLNIGEYLPPGTLVTLVVSHWTIGSLPSINWSLSPLTGLKPIKINVNYPLGQENPRQSPHQSTAGYFDKSILM